MTITILVLLCWSAIVAPSLAASSGKVGECNPKGNFGCNNWDKNNKVCNEASPGHMPWATRPVATDKYTVRTGQGSRSTDPTSYTPGKLITFYVSVNDYDWKYRGLLMDVVNAQQVAVGSWELPSVADTLFWSPSVCPKALLHSNAQEKPFTMIFRFRAPPAGAGTLTVRALFKRGPATTGGFYYPNGAAGDLTLSEGPAFTQKQNQWLKSAPGQSCNAACAAQQLSCSQTELAKATTASALRERVEDGGLVCALPLLSACGTAAPLMSGKAACFFHNDRCGPKDPATAAAATCGATPPGPVSRLCACTKAGGIPPPPPPAPKLYTGNFECHAFDGTPTKNNWHYATITASGLNTYKWTNRAGVSWTLSVAPADANTLNVGQDCPYYAGGLRTAAATWGGANNAEMSAIFMTGCSYTRGGSGAANRRLLSPPPPPPAVTATSGGSRRAATLSPLALVLAALALPLAGGLRSHSPPLVVVALLVLLGCSGGAQAHNWMVGRSRSANVANPLKPCRGRTVGETHFQVGPGQDFGMAWAQDHSGFAYFATIREEDAEVLTFANYSNSVRDYINSAPASANIAQTPRFTRNHATKRPQNMNGYPRAQGRPNPTQQQAYGSAELATTDPGYIDVPDVEPEFKQFKYVASETAGDRYVEYSNPKYPWLLSAGKYEMLAAFGHDHSNVRWRIPSSAPTGHYVVNWWWLGYWDCVDVDKLPTAVTHVNGQYSGNLVYTRVDHCQFKDPHKVLTTCQRANTNAQVCKDLMDAAIPRSVKNDALSAGIAVVPLVTPASSRFQDRVNIPWGNASCAAAGNAAQLTGSVTRSPINWGGFQRTTTADTWCTSFTELKGVPLRDAVAACSPASCPAIAWRGAVAPSAAGETVFDFRICRNTATAAQSGWTLLSKPTSGAAVPGNVQAASGAAVNLKFSFQPSAATVSLPNGWLADRGDSYGARNGQTYGWSCAPTMRGRGSQNTVDDTYVSSFGNCSDSNPRTWSVSVPNAVYQVTTRTRGRATGCAINGVRSFYRGHFNGDNTMVNRIVVASGKINLQGQLQTGDSPISCNDLASIEIQKVGNAMTPAWMPASANPFWEMDAGSQQPMGLVTIQLPQYTGETIPFFGGGPYTCRNNWFFVGDWCNDRFPSPPAPYTQTSLRSMGFADMASGQQGAIVRVSNSRCVAGQPCPGTTCGTISFVVRDNNYLHSVNCGGAAGRYVSVQLPGSKRILDVKSIVASRASAPVQSPKDKICYGVTPREQTFTAAEYTVSLDPEDPVFYSTCYVRQRDITFLPMQAVSAPPSPRWRFNNQCLKCSSFDKWVQSRPSNPLDVPDWEMDAQCFFCVPLASLSNNNTSGALLSPLAFAGIAVAGVVIVAVVVGAFMVVLRTRKSGAKKGGGHSFQPANQEMPSM